MKDLNPFIIYVDGGFDSKRIADSIYKYMQNKGLNAMRFETELQYSFTKNRNSLGVKHDLNWYFFHRESVSLNVNKERRIKSLFNYIAMRELDICKSIVDISRNTNLIDVFIVKDNSLERLLEGLLKIYLELEEKPSKLYDDLPDLLSKYRGYMDEIGMIPPKILIHLQKPTVAKYLEIKESYFEELYFLDGNNTDNLIPFYVKENIESMIELMCEKDPECENMLDKLLYKDLIEAYFPETIKLWLDSFNNFLNKFKLLLLKEGIM